MRFADDEKTALAVNEHVSLRRYPRRGAHVSGQRAEPPARVVHRPCYRITMDKESGIVNDPSGREGFMRTWKHPGGFGFAGLSPKSVARLSLWFLSWGRGRMGRERFLNGKGFVPRRSDGGRRSRREEAVCATEASIQTF